MPIRLLRKTDWLTSTGPLFKRRPPSLSSNRQRLTFRSTKWLCSAQLALLKSQLLKKLPVARSSMISPQLAGPLSSRAVKVILCSGPPAASIRPLTTIPAPAPKRTLLPALTDRVAPCGTVKGVFTVISPVQRRSTGTWATGR